MTEPTTEAKAQAYDRVMEVLNNEYTVPAAGWQELREAARLQPTESERLERAVAIANERLDGPYFFGVQKRAQFGAQSLTLTELERLLGIDQ